MEKLKEELSNIAVIEVINADYVFTLLLRGKGLSNWKTFNRINDLVLQETGEKFPMVESMKNGDDFFMMVLKPKS